MSNIIDVLLLLALPASGKSELRKYMDSLNPAECRDRYRMGRTVQLDDFPYVHLMRRIDDAVAEKGAGRIYFHAADKPFQNPIEWITLVELLNEDFDDLVNKRIVSADDASQWLFDRFDNARKRAGGEKLLLKLSSEIRQFAADEIRDEAEKLLKEKNENIPDSLEDKTVVIEFARGGPHGAMMPLPEHFGYQNSLSALSKDVLKKASILYIWVTPEQSREKNFSRTDPNDPGSILHHGVPIDVMLGDYGTDDMEYLITRSDRKNTVKVEIDGETFYVPVGRFDNRVDKTTFLREDPENWSVENRKKVQDELEKVMNQIWEQYSDLHKS